MLLLRNLKQSDVPIVNGMVRENLKEEYDPGLLWQFAEAWPEGSIVAEDNGNIIAYLLAVKHTLTEARILLFVVVNPYRNRGIGAYMLMNFLTQCSLSGLKTACFEVRVSNQSAIRFYLKYGFNFHGLLEGYYRDGESAYLMRRGL